MSRRILVAYATAAGSTREVAAAVADTLREGGAQVDLHAVKEVRDLAGYDAVVLGSAIRGRQVLPEALQFAQRHAAALGGLPVAYFIVCATLMEDTTDHRQSAHRYLEPLRRIKEPVSEGLFAGKIEHRTLHPLMRWTMRLMKAPEGDWRDWPQIRAWAAGLAPRLVRPAPARIAAPAPLPTPAA
jgi:menaquinone-dependent protoporphyrinogen oxidase